MGRLSGDQIDVGGPPIRAKQLAKAAALVRLARPTLASRKELYPISMTKLTSLCVYCGHAMGRDPAYARLADELGRLMATNGIRLIYGGGGIGLMGVLAKSIMDHGGKATGIIPGFLEERESGNRKIDDLRIVDNMHQRKQMMFELADGFVVLPGGFGTLDETFEIVTWRQLGLHNKPIALVNHKDYWSPLLAQIDRSIAEGFVAPHHRDYISVVEGLSELLATLRKAIGQPQASLAARI